MRGGRLRQSRYPRRSLGPTSPSVHSFGRGGAPPTSLGGDRRGPGTSHRPCARWAPGIAALRTRNGFPRRASTSPSIALIRATPGGTKSEVKPSDVSSPGTPGSGVPPCRAPCGSKPALRHSGDRARVPGSWTSPSGSRLLGTTCCVRSPRDPDAELHVRAVASDRVCNAERLTRAFTPDAHKMLTSAEPRAPR
jgi:hypothetical protein